MAFLPEIYGHDDAVLTLRRTLESGRWPPGFLFSGEAGIGKRTLALAFAREVMTLDLSGQEKERASRRIGALSHPDLSVLEREEGQRTLGIEAVRDLKGNCVLKPAEAGMRVGVVVDAERLSEEAGNALLKLLEEPPPKTLLILTARERSAVLETLVSRCRHVPLRPLCRAAVTAFLTARGTPEGAALLAAWFADGRPGHALALLEDGLSAEALGDASLLALGGGAAFALAAKMAAAMREGTTKLEGARDHARPILRQALGLLRIALGCRLGSRTAALARPAIPGGVLDRLLTLDPDALEGRILLVLRALSDIDRNLSVDSILEGLLLDEPRTSVERLLEAASEA